MSKTCANAYRLIPNEDAYEELARLSSVETINLHGVSITFGVHDLLGSVQIIIPAAGDAALCYPFENTDSFLYKKE